MADQIQNKTTARQRSQAETRRRLLEEAARLFAKSGSTTTTTKEIASAAGVAVGTLYLHFKDKDGLLKEVLRLALTRLKQELGKHSLAENDGAAQIRVKMETLADFTQRFPHLAAVLFDPSNLGTAAGREAHAFLLRSQENGLTAGIAAGHYRGDIHPGLVARALLGILVQVLGWWGRNPEGASKAEVVDTLVELRLNGLKPAS